MARRFPKPDVTPLVRKLRVARDLLRHAVPSGDPAEIFDRAHGADRDLEFHHVEPYGAGGSSSASDPRRTA